MTIYTQKINNFKMEKPILFFFVIVFLTSCIKESTTNIKAYYSNPT